MNSTFHSIGGRTQLLLLTVAALAVFGAMPRAASLEGESPTVEGVQRALERLPYFGVFDFIAFKVDRGTVTLHGFAYQADLHRQAERAVKRAAGVDAVVNEIDVLPPSPDDDRLRFALYYSIYQDDFLSRYTPGGPTAAAYGLMSFARFPGMQPFGVHAVHIVVRHRRVSLFGVVTSTADRTLVDLRARQVSGILQLDNHVQVR